MAGSVLSSGTGLFIVADMSSLSAVGSGEVKAGWALGSVTWRMVFAGGICSPDI